MIKKIRFASAVLAVASIALAAAGCGDGGGSNSSDMASLAPPRSPLFVEATIEPQGELKSNVEAVARKVAGVDDLGDSIVSELESMAGDGGESLDFAKEVEPWLGKEGALFFESYDGEDFTGFGLVLPSTDTAATEAFIDDQAESNDDPVEKGSYEGVDYWVDSGDDTVIGLVGDSFLGAESKRVFEHAVDASEGDSLADRSEFEDASSAAVEGSLADVYVDVGALVKQREGDIDPQALQALRGTGVEPTEATAVASVLPGSDQIEIEVSSELGDRQPPRGEASELLGTLPIESVAAFAFSGFGEQLKEALDELDKSGIPGEIPPGELKKGVSEFGFDLDKVAGSLEDAGIYVTGSREGNIGGALVLTTSSSEVATAIKTITGLARQSGTPGLATFSGKESDDATGFAVRREDLGPRPLVVATKGDRVAIGYGVVQTMRVLTVDESSSLAGTPDYEAAVESLGGTPISGFVDGKSALRLADSFISSGEEDFEQAKPYLEKIRFVAIGSGSDDERATARLIVGLEE